MLIRITKSFSNIPAGTIVDAEPHPQNSQALVFQFKGERITTTEGMHEPADKDVEDLRKAFYDYDSLDDLPNDADVGRIIDLHEKYCMRVIDAARKFLPKDAQ